MGFKEYRLSTIILANIAEDHEKGDLPHEAALQYIKIIQKHTEDHDGKIIEDSGDSILVDFPNTITAVNCAIHIGRELREEDNDLIPLRLKMAVHLGDIHFFENGASGEGIDIVRLLQGMNEPGQICISGDVYNLVKNKIDTVSIKEIGAVRFKNMDREITAWQLSMSKTAETSAPDPKNFPYNIRQSQYNKRQDQQIQPEQREQTKETWEQVYLQGEHQSQYGDQQFIQEYRKQTHVNLKKLERSFKKGSGRYIGVNAVFTAFWLASGAGFPWVFFPIGGWGIGVASNYFNLRLERQNAKELQAFPAINKRQLKKLRKFQKKRSSYIGRMVSTFTVSCFLFGINLITGFFSPWVVPPWFIIPVGILMTGALIAHITFKGQKKRLLAELAEVGIPVDLLNKASHQDLGFYDYGTTLNPMQVEASTLRAAILAQISEMPDRNFLGENFEQVLDDYVNQVTEMSKKEEEIKNIQISIPMDAIENELLDLQRQHEKIGNPELKVELEKAIDSIQKQKNSYLALKSHHQLLRAKLSASINSLRQLQLDLLRMKQTSTDDLTPTDLTPTDQLLMQTGEINNYLSDFEAEYRRLEAMDKSSDETT